MGLLHVSSTFVALRGSSREARCERISTGDASVHAVLGSDRENTMLHCAGSQPPKLIERQGAR